MDKRGLSSQEAEVRLKKYGFNELKDVGRISPAKILLRQVKNNFVIYLLVFAMVLSFYVENSITGYSLLALIVLVIFLGFIQEYRAENAINALKSLISPVSVVIRDGIQQEINANRLVPGDVIVLRTGDRIPADCVILEENEVRTNESVVTGESAELSKSAIKDMNKLEDKNKLLMGSYIVSGRAVALIENTGMKTKFGAIANLISREDKELPLQAKVNSLTKNLVYIALVFAILTGISFLFRSSAIDSKVIVDMLLIVIALSVSAFPESFPVVLVTTLSAGAYRMARQNAIVNRMSVIETLGETTVICSDKTGTLTKGEMTVKYVFSDDKMLQITGTGYNGDGKFILDDKEYSVQKDKVLSMLCKASVLCNDATISRTGKDLDYKLIGSPTEGSLLIMASKAGLFKDDLDWTRVSEKPFTSERKMMSVLVKQKNESVVFTKGAPEYVISKCSSVERNDGIFTLTSSVRERIMKEIRSLNARGYRTLALAYNKSKTVASENAEGKLTFLGFVAMEDPPREEVTEALGLCRMAGISVKMITGDNRETALSIAKQIGLAGPVLTGEQLDGLSDKALVGCVSETVIFARVRPEHKMRIVSALKEKGEIVTMTGDGVNDAPALKASHVGVAMGKSGTDVSRSVADITLKDDNFSTIVSAVREGRTIFNNMRKFTTYQISCNFAEITIIFLGILLGLPIPLVAIQILFMNMVTDDIPAITLGLNPSSRDVMERKPRRNASLMNREMFSMVAIAGAIMGLGTLWIYYYSLNILGNSLEVSRTIALVSLIAFEIVGAFNFRSFRKPVLGRSLFVNRALVWASLISAAATLAIIQTPINIFFETVPLSFEHWMLALTPALLIVIVFDVLKHMNNKRHFWVDLN